MTTADIVVHPGKDVLAEAIAARLATHIVDLQASRGSASIALTGGGVGTACLTALAASPIRDVVDWSRIDLWWGDERFLPSGDPERNETQARAALLDSVPVDPARVHAMPASDGPDGDDVEAAASRYADEVTAAVRSGESPFDVVLLGVGPDGHVASLFPELPALHEAPLDDGGRAVVAVHGAPKPPPIRISLTLPVINAAREVWLLVAGAEKARAVHLALSGSAGPVQIPAAGVRGLTRTLWLVDHAAAAELPTH